MTKNLIQAMSSVKYSTSVLNYKFFSFENVLLYAEAMYFFIQNSYHEESLNVDMSRPGLSVLGISHDYDCNAQVVT